MNHNTPGDIHHLRMWKSQDFSHLPRADQFEPYSSEWEISNESVGAKCARNPYLSLVFSLAGWNEKKLSINVSMYHQCINVSSMYQCIINVSSMYHQPSPSSSQAAGTRLMIHWSTVLKQTWYSLFKICGFWYFMRKDFNYMCHPSARKW